MTAIKLHRWQVLYDDKQHHETSLHHCKSCWEQPSKTHCPPCCQAAVARLWRKIVRIHHFFLHPMILPSCTGPSNIVVSPTRGPANIPASDPPTSPEKSLALPAHKSQELPLLGCTVNTDQPHTISTAEWFSPTLGEGGAAKPPAYQVIPSLKLMVCSVSSSTPSSSSSSYRRSVTLWPTTTPSSSKESSQEAKLWGGWAERQTQEIEKCGDHHLPHFHLVLDSAQVW